MDKNTKHLVIFLKNVIIEYNKAHMRLSIINLHQVKLFFRLIL